VRAYPGWYCVWMMNVRCCCCGDDDGDCVSDYVGCYVSGSVGCCLAYCCCGDYGVSVCGLR
jgi:hypothetical protein